MNRRSFVERGLWGGGLLLAGSFPLSALAQEKKEPVTRLTILHTNDVHSRLDPFPLADGPKLAGQGGVVARAALIEKIRAEGNEVLLLDCGDIFQGTPYFNLYKGEPEMKAMHLMGYDAATMGNHDFDAGVEGFAKQLPWGGFPVLTANYDFAGTALEGKTQPYKTFLKGGIKVGIFGLGIELKGLVPHELCAGVKYFDPLEKAQATTDRLRKKEACDLVICLSHLGYDYPYNKVSDKVLARETVGLDLILGGHTHTFLEEPTVLANKAGKYVMIHQVGWGGLRLGRIDYTFSAEKGPAVKKAHSVSVGE